MLKQIEKCLLECDEIKEKLTRIGELSQEGDYALVFEHLCQVNKGLDARLKYLENENLYSLKIP